PGGVSRVHSTGTETGLDGPTTTTGAASATASSTRSTSVRPPTRSCILSIPPNRRAAPPARTTAANSDTPRCWHAASRPDTRSLRGAGDSPRSQPLLRFHQRHYRQLQLPLRQLTGHHRRSQIVVRRRLLVADDQLRSGPHRQLGHP